MTAAKPSTSYRRTVEFLYGLRWFGTKLGLENTARLAGLAGDPHRRLRFIHVAGTNGKGSTCAILESLYRSSGLRVGLFTSPHLVSFRERIQVNREWIGEPDVVQLVETMRPMLETFAADQHPTFFEAVTVMALGYFAERQCDLVIWETGLGGRLDATNIVTPLASVITNVQFDHQQWLGNTLADIAREKAGIIKPGVPVITAADEPAAIEVIKETAREQNAPLTVVDRNSRLLESPPAALPLSGEHQRLNAALALATVNVLQTQLPVSDPAIRAGLAGVNWPGRLQWITRASGQKILLDGAHNPAGIEALKTVLKADPATERFTLILGILRDKDWPGICKSLAPLFRKIFLVPVANERTAAPEELAEICRRANPDAQPAVAGSLAEALRLSTLDARVLITGSLYLVGEAMELLEIAPPGSRDERDLNEWSGAIAGSARKS